MSAAENKKDGVGSNLNGTGDDGEIMRSTKVKSTDEKSHEMHLLRSKDGKKTLLRFELVDDPSADPPTIHRRTFDLRELITVRVATDATTAAAPVKLDAGVPQLSSEELQVMGSDPAINEQKPLIFTPKPTSIPGATTLYLYFIARPGGNIWRVEPIVICFDNSDECASWENIFQQQCQQSHRPKALLVYVNPFGGRKSAWNIYRKKRPDHVLNELRSMDASSLYEFDGVISVGGDGSFNEMLCGAVIREQNDNQKDVADIDIDALVTPRLRLATIPAGSTNSVVASVQGHEDAVTAALHIAIGDDCGVDVCTIHRDRDLLRISANAVSYGWLGHILQDSEDFRHLGPVRYKWSGLRTILKHPTYRGRVAFRLSGAGSSVSGAHLNAKQREELKLPPCEEGCVICSEETTQETPEHDTGLSTRGGTVYPFHWQAEWSHVICCVNPCVSPITPKGLAPFTAIDDGSMDLTLIPKLSRTENLNFLRKVALHGGQVLRDDERVKVFRVSRFSFTPTLVDNKTKDAGVWNVDGEMIEQPTDTLHFRLHPRLIRYFGRESDSESEKTESKRCFWPFRKAPSAIITGD